MYQHPIWQSSELGADILKNGGHFLCAGTTGAGKSTFLHSLMLDGLAFSPFTYQFSFIDLKGGVELARYENLPHTIGFADNIAKANRLLDYNIEILERRLKELRKNNSTLYDGNTLLIVIDELADLISVGGNSTIERITKIMRLGRACKIRTMMFTQSPNRRCLVAEIQQNISSALCLRVRSAIESRQVIGVKGAETLPQFGFGYYWSARGIEQVKIPMTDFDKLKERIDFWNKFD